MTGTDEAWRVVARPQAQARDRLGEGPLWSDRENALYWVDILGPRLLRLDLATQAVREWTMPEAIGWVIERREGPAMAAGLVAGFASGFARLTLDPLAIDPIGDPQPDRPANRMNDAKADAAGRIWAGTKDESEGERQGESGALFRLDPDGAWTRMDDGYAIPNGPAIAPDGTFYHTDSARGTIYRHALTGDGTLGPRETFLTFPEEWGAPDGMTVDADGGLWVAHWGGSRVSRFLADGSLDRAIALPASQITSVCFAGPDLDRMFVTSAADGREDEEHAGALFEVDSGARGLPALRFAG